MADKVYVFKSFEANAVILAKSMEEALRLWRRRKGKMKHIDPDTVECLGEPYTREEILNG